MEKIKMYLLMKAKSEEDLLWVVRKLAIDFLHHPFMTSIVINVTIFWMILQVVQAIIFVQKFDGRFFIKYCSVYSGVTYVLITTMSYPFFCKATRHAFRDVKLWKIDIASTKIQKMIYIESNYFNVMVIVNSLLSIYSAVVFMIPNRDDPDIFYAFNIFEKLESPWTNALSWVYRMSYLPVCIMMSAPIYVIIYIANHMKFQIYILIQYLGNIDAKSDQKEIKRRLIFCIHRHREIMILGSRILKEISTWIMLYFIAGVLFGLSILVYYFSFRGTIADKNQRVISMAVAGGITFGHIVWSGQHLEDATGEMYEVLKRQKWYYWNSENKKIYLIFLKNAQEPFKAKFTENVSINYALGISVLKAVYSMTSVLRKIKNLEL